MAALAQPKSRGVQRPVDPLRVVLCGAYPEESQRALGGVEAVTELMASELARTPGVELDVLTLRSSRAPGATVVRDGVRVHYLARTPVLPFSVRSNWGDPRRGRSSLARLAPDIVHAEGLDGLAVAAVRGAKPAVVTPHGIGHRDIAAELRTAWDRCRLVLFRRLERTCLTRARHVITISPYVATSYERLLGGTVHPIENPIARSWFTPGTPVTGSGILFAGALRPLKGLQHLVDACGLLARQGLRPELRVAGGASRPEFRRDIEHRVAAHGLGASITFLGQLDPDRLKDEFDRCRVFCLPSLQESSPLVVAQAMARGRAVVASRIGGVPWQVLEGTTGLLVPPADPEALAAALGTLLRSEEPSRAMGAAARAEAVARFHPDVITARTVAVYRAILSNPAVA